MDTKTCTKCKQVKPYTEFGLVYKDGDQRNCRCIPCTKQDKKEFREKNKEKMIQKDKTYYQNNKQKWRDREQRLRQENPELLKTQRKEAQERYRANPDNTIRLRYLKSRYGIDIDQYVQMESASDGCCYICGHKPNLIEHDPTQDGRKTKETRLHVDHDHSMEPSEEMSKEEQIKQLGKSVRGLLCFNCNTGLRSFQDNPTLFVKAIQYLLDFNKKLDLPKDYSEFEEISLFKKNTP